MPHVIALTGPKGSGKDTVGQLIKDSFPDSARTIAFADPIKSVMSHLFALDPTNNDEYDKFKRTDLRYVLQGHFYASINGRHLVREIGMLMRSYDEQQFVRYVEEQIKVHPTKLWVVTDLRFHNELESMRALGAKIIKVERDGYDYDGHVTETGFDDSEVDIVINNDGDVETLKQTIAETLDAIFTEWSDNEACTGTQLEV